MVAEWPLILFTMALQMACGLCLAATLSDMGSTRPDDSGMRRLGLLIVPLTVLGLLGSVFHLGRPSYAFRSLSNLGSSRLSLEILLSVVFAVCAFVYSYLWRNRSRTGRTTMGVVSTIAGLVAVASSFFVYMIPSQPAWDSAWLPVSFFGTVLLFAGTVPASFVELTDRKLLKTLLGVAVTGTFGLLVSAIWMFAALSRTVGDDYANARLQAGLHLLTAEYPVWFGCYILLAILIPFGFAVRRWPRRDYAAAGFSSSMLLPVAVLGGTVIGRALMYAIGTAISSF